MSDTELQKIKYFLDQSRDCLFVRRTRRGLITGSLQLNVKSLFSSWFTSFQRKLFPSWARGELSYLAPLGSENISAPYFKQCFFRGEGELPPRLSQTPRLPVPRQVYSYVYKRKKTKCKYLFN